MLLKRTTLPDGVAAIGEEVIDYCLAEDADLGCRLDIGVGEHLTVGDLELAYTEVVLIDAVDGALGIVVAVNPLPRAVDRGRDGADVVAVFLDALVVGLLERLHGRGVLSHAAPHVGSGRYHNHVAAHLGDVGLDAGLAALTYGEHGDDGGDADDDAQGGEE